MLIVAEVAAPACCETFVWAVAEPLVNPNPTYASVAPKTSSMPTTPTNAPHQDLRPTIKSRPMETMNIGHKYVSSVQMLTAIYPKLLSRNKIPQGYEKGVDRPITAMQIAVESRRGSGAAAKAWQ